MIRSVNNKVAVITGGADGIGYATAEVFLQNGARNVVILDIDEKLGNDAVKMLNSKYGINKAEFIKCDVTKDLEPISKHIFETHKTVDILLNCAGIANEFALRKTIDTNVTAVLEFSLKFLAHMRKDKGGKGGVVVNVASIFGFRVNQFIPIYQASKFAIMGFTKSLGHVYNFNKTGVRVVAVCPGYTETKLAVNVNVSTDAQVQKDGEEFGSTQLWQKVDSVANAVIEVL